MTDEQVQAEIEKAVAAAVALLISSHEMLAVRELLVFFAFSHLPPHLRAVSCSFAELAARVAALSANAQTVDSLCKLLAAKDSAVRSVIK